MKGSHLFVVCLGLVVGARPASAGPKKLKAELLCGVYANDEITKVITGSGKVGKITDTIACALHLDGGEGHAVHVRTVVKGEERTNETGVVNEEGTPKDFEIYLKPNEAFKPCEDFEIQVGIYDPGGQFKKTVKVTQGCPKPAKVAAALTCSSEYGDGTPVMFPKAKKLTGRLEKTINCTIYAKKVPDGVALTGSVWVDGKTPHTDAMADTPPSGQKMDAALEPDTDFDVCSVKFNVHGSLVDADGAERWSGKLTVPAQFCPD